ncbi:TPA: hypothetical protein EYP27_00685 [Candidatus Bathyarchaeota archaeon]|nr:hypothetical protein [Candidatus Bathyarchaeota archaeon]
MKGWRDREVSRRSLLLGILLLLAISFLVSSMSGIMLLPGLPERLYQGSVTSIEVEDSVRLLKVPFVEQKPWYCSEASASMVLQYYGFNVSQEDVSKEGYDRFENMLPFLQRYVEAEYLKGLSLEEVKAQIDAGNPVILRILLGNYRHSVVVVGYDRSHIYIHDPAQGPYMKADPQALMKVWKPTGQLAITLKPKSA